MPHVATSEQNNSQQAGPKREYINISDLNDVALANLVEGTINDVELSDYEPIETTNGDYDSTVGLEKICIFKRKTDGVFFRYIYYVNVISDTYVFINVPQLEEVFPVQGTFYE